MSNVDFNKVSDKQIWNGSGPKLNENISNAIAKKYAFDKYSRIIELFHKEKVDVSENAEFQELFNSYFDVRRNDDWREIFYRVFQDNKDEVVTDFDTALFNSVINDLYKEINSFNEKNKGRKIKWKVEPSFVSKMIAVINPAMPILDSQVLENMGFEIKGNGEAKIDSAKGIYAQVCNKYKTFIESERHKSVTELFDTIFVNEGYQEFSETKKIDWFLWALSWEELDKTKLFEGLIKKEK